MKVKNLIIGAGLSGAVIAERLATQLGQESLIIEKRAHIAGNCYDYVDEKTGITVHKYGPHVFHTNNKQVWDYLSQFTNWHHFMYRVKAVIDGIEVNIPFNLDSLQAVFPAFLADKLERKLIEKFGFNKKVPILQLRETKDADLDFLATYIYEKVFLGYTVKQWGVKPEELDSSVSGRVPIYISRDDRYFQDTYQALPLSYTKMIENMLNHPLIQVRLNTDYETVKNDIEFDRLFYTGPIDAFFNYELGELPYRSLDLDFKTFNKEYYQSGPQINYPSNYDFTRAVEYKHYLGEKSHKTVVSFEYPCAFEQGKNERYYPIPDDTNHALYQQYHQKAQSHPTTHFLGRLGDYKYYNMDETTARALALFEDIMQEDNI